MTKKRTARCTTSARKSPSRAAPAAQTGKVFAGWKLGDKLYQPGDKLVLTGNTAFTSQFVNEVTISYVTGTMATLTDLKGGAG